MWSIAREVWFCAALILPVMSYGCSSDPEGNGSGGNGGTGGSGGGGPSVAGTIDGLCTRLDDCNELEGLSVTECSEIVSACVDESFVIESLKQDWALLVERCQEFSSCGIFVDCFAQLDTCGSIDGTGGTAGAGGGGGASGSGGSGGSSGCAGTEITCFPDGDGDGWPSASGATIACDTCPANLIPARSNVDCDDGNPDVFPGNEMFYFDCRPCGMQCCVGNEQFDYNCDGVSEPEFPVATTCLEPGCTGSGFLGQIPDCGVPGDFHRCRIVAMGLCEYSNFTSRQPCR